MNEYHIDDVITRTLAGAAAILFLVSILVVVGSLIYLFGFLTFIGILLGLSLFLFLSHWVGRWFVG